MQVGLSILKQPAVHEPSSEPEDSYFATASNKRDQELQLHQGGEEFEQGFVDDPKDEQVENAADNQTPARTPSPVQTNGHTS